MIFGHFPIKIKKNQYDSHINWVASWKLIRNLYSNSFILISSLEIRASYHNLYFYLQNVNKTKNTPTKTIINFLFIIYR